jgi:alpha-galactosidase
MRCLLAGLNRCAPTIRRNCCFSLRESSARTAMFSSALVPSMRATFAERKATFFVAQSLILAGVVLAASAMASAQGSSKPLAPAPQQHFGGGQPPFSFTYGGRPSSELLSKWKYPKGMQWPDVGVRLKRTAVYQDPETGLEVRAKATAYLDTRSGVEWTLYFTNNGTKDTPALESVNAIDVTFPLSASSNVTLHRLKGSECELDDWLPREDAVPPGREIGFAPAAGRPSSGACPFFNLQWDGGGVITAIGWSGQWAAKVERAKEGTVRLTAGMQTMHLKLAPHETIRSPRIMQLYWSGKDPWAAYNQFRRLMLAHIVPRANGEPLSGPAVPPIAHLSTSFCELNRGTEADVLAHLRSIEGLGFEVFWLDAYWTKDGFPNGMGNYGFPLERAEPRGQYPHGVKAIGDAVRAAGLKYLMWFEPERVARGTYLAKEHPEWVISLPGKSDGLLNLGNADAREYLTKYLIAAIKQYQLSWLRIDYNIDPIRYWRSLDEKNPDRVGMAEIRYVEGLYRMWDAIRAAYPELLIDNCASGGRRIDLETMSRSIPLWRSDNTCDMDQSKPATVLKAAIENQVMSASLNRYVPFSTVGQMGAEPYFFRSGFNGGIDVADDVRPKNYPRDLLRRAIAEGKRIRPYYFGDFYVLSDITVSPKDWCVLQYHRPTARDGMVVAFRRHESPQPAFTARLREIDRDAEYEVTKSVTYERGQPERLKGSQLEQLKIELEQRPGSVIIEYRAVTPR